MKFKDNVPIYLQIESLINQQIIAGKYTLGAKLPSVRDLSVQLEVNINTIQKALNELVQEQIIFTKRGRGNFVTTDAHLVAQLKAQLIHQTLENMDESLQAMGLSKQEIAHYLKLYSQERMGLDDQNFTN